MLRLSWQITLLVAGPAAGVRDPGAAHGRAGWRASSARRPTHNAAMTTQMTERFSAPGATLVKLFGRPEREERRVRRPRRAGRRDRRALGDGPVRVHDRARSVSALALALIYGLGGYLAVRGDLDAGTVVTLALLLGQLYAPLTALASARVDAMTALVSFERVFEVLDLKPLITEAGRRRPADRAGERRVRRRALRLPRRPTRSRSPRSKRSRCSTRAAATRCSTASRSGRAGPGRGAGRFVGQRQVDDRLARSRGCTTSMPARCGSAASTSAT